MIYIAGKIRGVPDYAANFAKAADKLRAQGHSIFNPAAANQEGRSLSDIMAYLIPQLCSCQAIALLPDYKKSPGALIELRLAKYIGLKVIYL